MLTSFPNNPGYLLEQLTEAELAPIWEEVRSLQAGSNRRPANQVLAGNIQEEYFLDTSRSHIEHVVMPRVDRYIQGFNYGEYLDQQSGGDRLHLGLTWVNFQRKGEFNPPHWHQGQFSFVIWLQIPYTFAEESQMAHSKNYAVNGDFHFQWTTSLGQIRNHSLLADRRLEGHVCVFPATMLHTVFPFYSSEETRITVSGNWSFNGQA